MEKVDREYEMNITITREDSGILVVETDGIRYEAQSMDDLARIIREKIASAKNYLRCGATA